jgi:sugar phosphate isomerase/epimerase
MIPVALNLPYNLRGRFPFRLATTSFIVPADWLSNVAGLASWFDEIELLFFESGEDFPGPALIDALEAVRSERGIGYNVHLPVDLPICDGNAAVRRQAAARMARIIKRCEPLAASTATLHLPVGDAARTDAGRSRWQHRVHETVADILASADIDGAYLSVENLDYPLEWLAETIDALDLGVCLDFGHLALAGFDPTAAYRRWASRCRILHLHAAENGRDHQPLDRLYPAAGTAIKEILAEFTGTVSLEIFSLAALQRSIAWLARSGIGGIDLAEAALPENENLAKGA